MRLSPLLRRALLIALAALASSVAFYEGPPPPTEQELVRNEFGIALTDDELRCVHDEVWWFDDDITFSRSLSRAMRAEHLPEFRALSGMYAHCFTPAHVRELMARAPLFADARTRECTADVFDAAMHDHGRDSPRGLDDIPYDILQEPGLGEQVRRGLAECGWPSDEIEAFTSMDDPDLARFFEDEDEDEDD
jgi:hypothetical protein